ncbi:MAG: amino acid adenylation domain-containing protein [Bacteroidota bacterium]
MIYLLPQTILAAAEKTPDKVAFVCGNTSWTYAETATKIQQLARALWTAGVRKGDRVGVFLNRSIETVVALHGIMHAGGVYVPMNPQAPASRSRFLIQDCDFKVAVTNPSQQKNLQQLFTEPNGLQTIIGTHLAVDGLECLSWEEIYRLPEKFTPPVPVLETDLAYIMYTSGSTGQPKGIMHTHASGLSYARLTADLYQLTEQDRFGNHAPIYFDISTLGYFTAPLVGATTVIATDAHTIFPTSMSSLIEKSALTVWYSVPLAIVQMLNGGLLLERDLTSLRWLFYAGEAFAPKYLRQFMEHFPHVAVSNIYGPAETNQCTNYNLPGPPSGDAPIPIGRTWNNTEHLIVQDNGEFLDDGAGEGELLIRSTTMLQGYWNRPDLTEKAIYVQAGPGGTQKAFYKTGDLVFQDAEGLLHFRGRKDNQIKVRGYRVELDAVETYLLAHETIAEAVVLPQPTSEGTVRLEAAVIVKKEAETVTDKVLLQYLGEKMPWYAVPERVHFLTDFPRTGSGKVNRPALKKQLEELA